MAARDPSAASTLRAVEGRLCRFRDGSVLVIPDDVVCDVDPEDRTTLRMVRPVRRDRARLWKITLGEPRSYVEAALRDLMEFR